MANDTQIAKDEAARLVGTYSSLFSGYSTETIALVYEQGISHGRRLQLMETGTLFQNVLNGIPGPTYHGTEEDGGAK